ncbi:MAG: putative flippase GtrA [Gammaproteobacteria bacterium]
MVPEFSRYLVVGVGSNVVNFMCYAALHSIDISLYIASLVGYLAGLFVSYIFGRLWVFGKRFPPSNHRLILFTCVYFVGGIIMSTIIGLLEGQFEIDYRICWTIGASFAVLNNFFGQKFIVFKKLG